MSLNTNFNVNPYYDDFDEDKGFVRLLFKPGYAVQSRELTQLQTVLQNQVNKFGNHVFKNGSLVTGGEFFLHQGTYVKVANTYTDVTTIDVDVTDFENKTIYVYSGNTSIKEAKVLKGYDFNPGTGEPKTLLVAQTLGDSFDSGEVIETEAQNFATVLSTANSSGKALLFSVNEGVFYYDGFFIQNAPQTIAISKYSTNDANASARIGFEIIETIVKSTEDTSLLDPAQDATNYQAPGSDRYKLELVLSSRDLSSTDTTKFIELMRVENGVILSQNKFPIYSVLEDTLARRTYDESGNYTVRSFQISLETNSANSAQTDVILSPGKAYVFGYEFETISPTRITVDKPREYDNVSNEFLSTEYGYFVYTTKHRGTFPINSLSTVSLHCVPNASINVATANTISNTRIGTARVKTIAFDDSETTLNTSSYVYRTYLFDVNITNITGNVISATTNTVTLGSTGLGNLSTVNGAYVGANFKITSGNGSTELVKIITDWDGENQIATLSDNFTIDSSLIDANSSYSINFEIGDVESIVVHSGTTIVASADIDHRSKDPASPYEKVFITGRDKEPLIFEAKYDYLKTNSIADVSYSYKRLYQGVNFSSGVGTLSSLSGQSLVVSNSESAKKQNFYVAVTSSGTSSYPVGSIVPSSNITVGNNSIIVTGGGNMTANVIATVQVSSGDLSIKKTKQLIEANTNKLTSISGTDVFSNGSIIVYPANGEVRILSTYTTKNSNDIQSLFLSDVISIEKIVDYGDNAISSISNVNSGIDITDRYVLDNGQRDSFYDHASIKLKPKSAPPTGNVVVFCNRFLHSVYDGGGYFSVDSYPVEYENIPKYTSTIGKTYELRDCLDFRPAKADGDQSSSFNVRSESFEPGPAIPITDETFLLDYSYYLPRIDKIILGKDKQFKVIKGVSSLSPVEPKDVDTAMTLFVLRNPAYVINSSDISIRHFDHKRYTMRDIGKIEKRVENLEYYTTLSLIEQSTLTQQDFSILDSQNLSRFKNGILVDGLTGFAVSDVENTDYVASIDSEKRELRPSFTNDSLRLTFDSKSASNFNQHGFVLTKNSNSVPFIAQNVASTAVNVNPFNVLRFDGVVTLLPDSDIWVDTETRPNIVVDISGDLAAWKLIANQAFSRTFSNWNTNWFGIENPEVRQQTGTRTRTVTTTTIVPEKVTTNLGERVVDVSIIPFMRSIYIIFNGSGFKPNSLLYPFFDNISVSDLCHAHNLITVDEPIDFDFSSSGTINFYYFFNLYNTANPSSFSVVGLVTGVSQNTIHFYPFSVIGTLPADLSDLTVEIRKFDSSQVLFSSTNVNSYTHNYAWDAGTYTGGSTTFTLLGDAKNSTNSTSFVGKKFTYVDPTTFQTYSATITAYNSSTNVVTLSNALSPNSFSTGEYFIDNIRADKNGLIVGSFYVPPGIFRTGEKSFRLINNSTNDTGSASSLGDTKFIAQGIRQTKESTILSVTVPRVSEQVTTETRPIYYDPLAQTFAVDPSTYPRGLFLDKVRLCFQSKSSNLPIRLEIRPTVNGYPDSSTSYPFSTVVLNPNLVKVTDSPNLDDSTKYTEFVFPAPVYLLPGEHAIVLISDSNEYEVYCAEIGKQNLVTGELISEPPYGGSLFKSQNARTWTAEQNLDMMFKLYRHSFSTSPTVMYFNIPDYDSNVVYPLGFAEGEEPPVQLKEYEKRANAVYDAISLLSSDIELPGTQLVYEFNSYTDTPTSQLVGYKQIVPGINYEMDDGSGRRTIYGPAGNNGFILKATLSTLFDDVSPVIDYSHLGVFLVKNVIGNLSLSNSDIVVTNSGSGYSNVTVTVTGGGATIDAQPIANIVGGKIDKIYFPTEESRGAGYTTTPTITITSLSGSGAVAIIDGEDQKSGGTAEVRHLTKTVTLADGFDSADLRVYLTAYKPLGGQIYVYYKVLSESDSESFNEKKWTLMTQLGPQNVYSVKKDEYREFVFAPGTNGTPDNFIAYDSYNSFKTFQIKIVMGTDKPTNPPKITDIRVIALPDGR